MSALLFASVVVGGVVVVIVVIVALVVFGFENSENIWSREVAHAKSEQSKFKVRLTIICHAD